MSNFLGKKFGEVDIIALDDGFRNDGLNPNPSNPYRPKEPLIQKMKEKEFNKQLEKERIKQLQIARDNRSEINFAKGRKKYIWLVSIGVAVLSYKFAKNKKEFYAFVGLLSPTLIGVAKSKYDEKMKVKKAKIQREKFALAQA